MTEIEFLDQFISPAPSVTPAYYVMYRGAKDELFLELQSTEKLSVKAQQLAASDGDRVTHKSEGHDSLHD